MSFQKLQKEIGDWHIETFGPGDMNKRLARKLLEESAEFMVARNDEEAADVLIVLMAWAERNKKDLLEVVRAKFEVVRGRDQKSRDQ